ncbi:MAG: hypothetical protein V3U72_01895 [Candidatus Aenigmarchaeota archaeon]
MVSPLWLLERLKPAGGFNMEFDFGGFELGKDFTPEINGEYK